MTSGVQLISSIQRKKHLSPNNLVIKQPNLAEIQVLYEAIKENIKVVNSLFNNESKYEF